METLRDLDVVRAAPLPTMLRDLPEQVGDDAGGEGGDLMVVRFSPYDTWYEIDSFFEGRFLERTVRGAFAKTMHDALNRRARDGEQTGNPVKVMFNHGSDMSIDQKVLGVVEDLREDDDSAVGEVRLFTEASFVRDLMPAIRAGAYGSSFMFRVTRDDWNDEPARSESNPDGLPERTIREVKLMEFGPVTWPANPAATVGMRSCTDEFYERIRARDPQRYDDLRSRALAIRTPNVDAAPQGTSTDGAAGPPTDAPATSHPTGLTPAQRAARLRELAHPYLKETA